jgi:Ni/Co efflux regulator RcnB
MRKMQTAALVLSLSGLMSLAAVSPPKGQEQREDKSRIEHQVRPEYHFRQEDAARLRQNYDKIDQVDVHHRPAYAPDGHLPTDWRKRVHPVPTSVIRDLPPIPAGYQIGYMDGYCVVFDPTSLLIADVIDLTNVR